MITKNFVSDSVAKIFSDKYKLIDKDGVVRNATEKYPIFIYKDFVDFVFESDEKIDLNFDEMMDDFSKME